MSLLHLEFRLCLNDIAVPLRRQICDFRDSNKLTQTANEDQQLFWVLDIKCTSDVLWMTKALGLSVRYWTTNYIKLPLIKELKEAILNGKPKHGAVSRLPRLPQVVVAVNVRGLVVCVLNNSKSLTLAMKINEEKEVMEWFLKEIEKDIQNLVKKRAPSCA